MSRQLEPGDRIVDAEALLGGITADVRRLTVASRSGKRRHLVLRTYVGVQDAADRLSREAQALTALSLDPPTGLRAVVCSRPTLGEAMRT